MLYDFVLPPYIILQNLVKLPHELKPYENQAMFGSSATGWINRNLFFGFSIFFANLMSHYRLILPLNLRDKKIILTIDGHNSRTSVQAVKYLRQNNIDSIVLPTHMSYLVQAFDVSLAGNS